MSSRLVRTLRGLSWVAYFCLLGFLAGVFLGAILVGDMREKAGYRKAKQELLNETNTNSH